MLIILQKKKKKKKLGRLQSYFQKHNYPVNIFNWSSTEA